MNQLDFQLQERRREHIPSPVPGRMYLEGQSVHYGAHPNAMVNKVYDEGKLYEIKTWGDYQEYGRPVQRENLTIVTWLDIMPLRSVEENKKIDSVVVDPDKFQLNYGQRQVSSLLSLQYHAGVNDAPVYQRDYCWDANDEALYIESVMEGRDIGKFVFSNEGYHTNKVYEIVDGKQRLHTLSRFFEDRLTYKGKKFSELAWHDQYLFENAPVAVAIMERATMQQKIKVFLAVNVTGKPQDPSWMVKVEEMLQKPNSPACERDF